MPDISTDEIRNALKKMKRNKSWEEDNIFIEAVKIGGDRLLENIKKYLTYVCTKVKHLQDGTYHFITQKGRSNRPRELPTHNPVKPPLLKLFTKIITNRLETKLDFYHSREQPIIDSCFVEFRKSFDMIEINSIMRALEENRINYRYSKLITNIYNNSTITVRLYKDTKCVKIKREIRQGDTLSPKLFMAVLEYALKKPGVGIQRNQCR
ncbi:uncharacterized protein [Diabrotica undecimpunctata]|uniref:uncharacterized protein n=1 Tax=Diabrotica undecimpunctata TaxID=50387 RepID=UPI003B6347A4